MSTRGRIGVLRPDGRVESIYNHYDSYVNGGLGDILRQFYTDPKIIDELIKAGDRSSLYGKTRPGSPFLGREESPYDFRKDDLYDAPSRFDDDEDSYWDNEDDWDIDYKYLYVPENGGDWYVNGKRKPLQRYSDPNKMADDFLAQPQKITNDKNGGK